MGTVYWEGKVEAVAQVMSGSIDSVDATPANNTFHVTIGGIAISAVGNTDVATTAGNLVTSLNASTHPYFDGITWANPSGGTITGTSDNAGVPHTASLTETGAGTGTVTDFSDTTANKSPNDWSDADNWDTGAVPVSTDDVIIKGTSVGIHWGLSQAAVDLTSLIIEQSFTGTIGLKSHAVVTTNGDSTDTAAPEYRATYLDIGADEIDIGQHLGPGSPAGSQRIKLDNDKAGASELRVHNSASSGQDSKPAIMYLAAHANADVEVRAAPGGFGVAVDVPGETATVGDVLVVPPNQNTDVFIGGGVTMTNYKQRAGDCKIAAAATITLVQMDGGDLDIEGGDYLITTLTLNGGDVVDRHSNGVSAIITTLNLNGGSYDLTQQGAAVTITNFNPEGGDISCQWDDTTLTTINEPTGLKKLQVSDL